MNRIGPGFGDIQLLKTEVKDKTEISYRQKLQRDLNSILVDDQEIEKVKNAFHGHIFLSYRKKDRKYAHELMHTIHGIPSLDKVSIWYDEFISSGEKWSKKIDDVLKNSDVFLLMATPSITEPDNYVVREEYPAAIRHNKKIITAVKEGKTGNGIDLERVHQLFPNIKTYVDGNSTKELEKVLCELGNHGTSDAENDYLVGLAYFNGIDIEKNNEKAISLIIASAKKNFPAAIRKLSDMYWSGDGIPVNYENSIQWKKRLVDLYQEGFERITSVEEMRDYVEALENLTSCLYDLSSFRESMQNGKRLVSLLERITSFFGKAEFNIRLESAYDLCEMNAARLGLFDEAIDYSEKSCALVLNRYRENPTTDSYHNLSVAYERLGDVYYSVGEYKRAEEWYQKAVEIGREIDTKVQSVDSAYALSSTLLVSGDVRVRNHEYKIAEKYYTEALELRDRVLRAEDSTNHKKQYGEALVSKGTLLMLNEDVEEAKKFLLEAKNIFEDIAEKCGTIESYHAYSLILNRWGKIYEMEQNYTKALEYYKESSSQRKSILKHIRTNETVYEYALTQYFIAEVYRRTFETSNAKCLYEEVIDLLQPVVSTDRKGDCHHIIYESAFERFKIDTYTGEKYLHLAIDSLKWLVDHKADKPQYQKQYDYCKKIYERCYPN